MYSFLKKRIPKKNNRGFTLIELLVTIMIFVILTGVVLFNQNGFNNTVLINNLAYDIALTVRQAQNYGTNVNESQSAINPFSSYGAYFNISPSGGSPTNFVFFADTVGGIGGVPDGKYDGTPSNGSVTNCPANDSECIQRYTIGSGNYIKSICTVSSTNQSICNSTLTILFKRPNPDALIYADGNTTPLSSAQITVSSASGITKTIVITAAGQIYVQK